MKNPYLLCKRDYRRLQDRAYRAQQKDQSEVCGAIVSTGKLLYLEFMKNYSDQSGSFKILLAELCELRRKLKNTNKRIFGNFHSHVVSEPIPSKRDVDEAPINSLMLIYDTCGRKSALYRVIGTRNEKSISQREIICQ